MLEWGCIVGNISYEYYNHGTEEDPDIEIVSITLSDGTCYRIDVTYDNLPAYHCQKCGGIVVRNRYGYSSWIYTCIKCGDSAIVPIDTNDES